MCSEDVFDLLADFPLHLKVEPLDDLFETPPKPILNKKFLETTSPFLNFSDTISKSSTEANLIGIKSTTEPKIKNCTESKTSNQEKPRTCTDSLSPKPTPRIDSPRSSGVTTADENALVGGPANGASVNSKGSPVNMKASKLHPYEDFHSFLTREGGIERERLARLVSSQEYPRPDEDFVSFLARSIGINDEQYVTDLRQALRCEAVVDYPPAQAPVKMELDHNKLEVGPDEDALSFFVRAGSWESSSSVDEEFASVGLDEDEDAESFLRRTGNLSSTGFDFETLRDSQCVPSGMGSFITAKEELEALQNEVLVQVSSPSDSSMEPPLMQVSPASTLQDMEGVVVNRKRRSSDVN